MIALVGLIATLFVAANMAAATVTEAPPPMRWERYGAGSEVDHFAWWCRTYLIQSIEPFAGLPLILEQWQLEFMGEALAVDAAGRQLWQSVALIVSRKNGKTQMLAAYALYRLLNDDGYPEILLAAASDKNAGRLFDAVVLFVRANPELARQVHLREYIGEISRADGGGKIIRLATDPTTLDGYNPSLVICDELHAWTKPRLRTQWSKLITAGGSRTKRQVFTITTAGSAAERKTSILGQLLDGNEAAALAASEDGDDMMDALERQLGLTISRNAAGETLIYNYSAPTNDRNDVESLKLANPASWVTTDYLARQAANPELSSSDVLQFHGCVWALTSTTWLDPQWFEQLGKRRTIDENTYAVFMFDGSYSRDSTCIVGATIEEKPHVWVEAVWEKPFDSGPEWRTPRMEVFAAIESVLDRYDVAEFNLDPPGWHREIEELEQTYGDVADGGKMQRFETNQPRRMGPAIDDFVQAVLGPGDPDATELDGAGDRGEPEMTHDGSEVLLRHLSNCFPDKRFGQTLIKKESPDSPNKIDVVVGAVVAYHRAKWLFTNEQADLGAVLIDPSPPASR